MEEVCSPLFFQESGPFKTYCAGYYHLPFAESRPCLHLHPFTQHSFLYSIPVITAFMKGLKRVITPPHSKTASCGILLLSSQGLWHHLLNLCTPAPFIFNPGSWLFQWPLTHLDAVGNFKRSSQKNPSFNVTRTVLSLHPILSSP